MIKAVIFDCFGVLVRDGRFLLLDTYFGTESDKRMEASSLMGMVGAGLIDHGDFLRKIADLANVSVADVSLLLADNAPDDELFEYIERKLKPHYKIGLLSNAADDWTERLFGKKRAKLFDEIVLSYQLGTVKPDRIMYETIASRLGLQPDECVFVVDQKRHCDGALASGMSAIVHINADKTITKLEELLHA